MIKLSKIQYKDLPTAGRLECSFQIDNEPAKTIWVETTKEFSSYLTYERSDAFVLGILNWAMRNGHDIESETPMGEYLYYQLTRYLIPGLAWGSKRMHPTKIICPIDSSELPNAGFVGTGISCGVDSLYSICTNNSDELPLHKVTHLTFFNVGSHGQGEKAKKIFKERLEQARDFCEKNDYPLVIVDSNFHDVFPQNHFLSATYSAAFAIYSMQKMWRLYYMASAGNDLNTCDIIDNDRHCAEDYELFSLPLMSSDQLRIESSGMGVTRQQKIEEIIKYEPSYTSLNVCTLDSHNCTYRCEKCIRTVIGLDVAGALDKYSPVFDVEHYRKHPAIYHEVFLSKLYDGWILHRELYPHIKNKISLTTKAKARAKHVLKKLGVKRLVNSIRGRKPSETDIHN